LLHLVGDLFEVYDDARTYKPSIYNSLSTFCVLNSVNAVDVRDQRWSSGASHCCRWMVLLMNQWRILKRRGWSSGTVQCRIVYPSAVPDLQIRVRHWHAVPVRKHHVVKTCRQYESKAPQILDLDV